MPEAGEKLFKSPRLKTLSVSYPLPAKGGAIFLTGGDLRFSQSEVLPEAFLNINLLFRFIKKKIDKFLKFLFIFLFSFIFIFKRSCFYFIIRKNFPIGHWQQNKLPDELEVLKKGETGQDGKILRNGRSI
jgi:hypothetical protein